jgi:YfiH family protein
MKNHTLGSLQFYSYDALSAHDRVSCVITTRAGGLSSSPFEALNLGMRCGDDPGVVVDNRAQLSWMTGAFPDLLTFGRQVHGRRVSVVTGELIGSGAGDLDSAIPETDAMITDIPDVPLVVLIADCVAVSLYDPVNNAIGLAHAGWRGTAAGIVVATVEKMTEAFGSSPEDLVAGVSPSIGPCCYEVGSEVAGKFRDSYPASVDRVLRDVQTADGGIGTHLDLWAANRLQLTDVGVRDANIETSRMCTSCRTDLFYSHRAERGRTGRFASVMMLHDKTRRVY